MSSFSHGCDEDTGLLPTLCQMKQQDHNQTNSVQGQLNAGKVSDTNKAILCTSVPTSLRLAKNSTDLRTKC